MMYKYKSTFISLFFFTIMAGLTPLEAQDLTEVKPVSDKVKAPGAINSDEYVEYAPSISADGKTMIIESDQNNQWQLFESKLQPDNTWSALVPLDNVNNYGDSLDLIGGPSISYDGNILYFFASFREGYGSEDIYYSTREGDSWSEPRNIGPPINTAGYEGFPSVSSNGKDLYFTKIKDVSDLDIEKDFSESCYEIWVSHKGDNGYWSEPEKLPYPVNNLCDKSPRIMADNRTLIFSSYRPGVKGSYDLFQSTINEDDEWTTPVPLDYVNTPEGDQFACISASGEILYFFTQNDIYTVEIPVELRQFKNVIMQGYVLDDDTKRGLGASIRVIDAETAEELYVLNNNPSDGRYSVVMAAGRKYNIEFVRDGYSMARYPLNLVDMVEYNEIRQDVNLFQTVRLKVNVYDQELFEAIPGICEAFESGSGSTFLTKTSDESTGYTILELPVGQTYNVKVGLENFSEETFKFDVSGIVLYRDFETDIGLIPQKLSVPINVSDITTNGKVRGRIIIRNKSRDEVIEVNSNEMIALRVGDRYEIEATSDKGYFFASTSIEVTAEGIKTTEERETATVEVSDNQLEMKLTPIETNTSLNLNDILFETGSAQLSEVSYEELARVVEVMVKNPTMKVEISAHTDDVGSPNYNQALSFRRAQSVVDYLTANNIPQNRFEARGYGELRPIIPNTNEANRALNRRVELKVLEVLD